MLNIKRNVLSVALASAILAASGQVHAQATPATETTDEAKARAEAEAKAKAEAEAAGEATVLDTLEVTGIRAGIENAIETKETSTSIVEAISAEDIGKLPDTSIADSIARLPGLTAQRDRGRASEINIRGLAGDFAATTLNGREQVSLGNNRGVEFDQYPSELMSQVVVYKTADASLVGQGLSGTVDLQTLRPLNYSERTIAVNARGDMSKLGDEKEYGNRFSISYIDQFADNTVGLALGYARLNNPNQGHQFEAWGYNNGLLGGGKLYDFQNDNTRDGFMAAVEYRPTDSYRTMFDFYYSRFDKEEIKRGMEFGIPGTVTNRVNDSTGTATSFDFTGFDPVMRNDFNGAEDTLMSFGWEQQWTLSDAWTVNLDLSASRADRQERILETYAGFPAGVTDSGSATLNPDGYFDFEFGFDYGNPDNFVLTDAGGWGQDGYVKDFEVRDNLMAARADFERTFESGAISSIEFGFNITDREKSRASNENFLCLVACRDGATLAIPDSLLTGNSFNFAGLPAIFGYDARAALASVYALDGNENGDIANKNWSIDETVSTLFVQANIDTDLGSVPVRGNIGVQIVQTDQSSNGFATYEGNPVGDPINGGAKYTDVLPSLNLNFTLPWEQKLRFGAGRQMARPRMDQMRANAGYGIDRGRDIWSGGGGNPELEPWIANSLDLSYEKYFGGRGYVSAAYFYKDLRTYIYDQVVPFDFSGLAIPPGTLPADIPPSNIGEFTSPQNGEGGKLKGLELAVSVPFDLLWAPLEGLGLQASYTDSDTSISPDGPGTTTALPGFSKYTSNVTLYYERYGFSIRGSRRSRSEFLGEVQGFGGDRTRILFAGEAVVDFQVGYTLQSGPLKDLSFLLQVNNLTDEPFRSTYDGLDQRPRQFFEYGRNYLFGINYKF
ncbi:TonB-dependent receptor [Arenimonas sp. MALMAid1274]|uniref:TonB-dependent receptor n=1 Tax=Arenimonas sp. MALMAid1274 TaxID=3411630 RepID=UPI003BA37323